MQRACFELLGGALFTVKRPVDQTQKGTKYGVGVHVQNGHSGGGGDRKRGGELTRVLAFTPDNHIDIFYGGWLSSPPFSGVYIYIYIRGQGMDNKKDFSVAMSVGFSGTFSKEQTSARPSRLGRHCW